MNEMTPVQSLPDRILNTAPILGAALDEVHGNTQASYGLCLAAALASISTVCQGLADVRTPLGVIPTGLFITAVAGPGEGKSPAESVFMKPIREREALLIAEHEDQQRVYSASTAEWKMKNRALERQLRCLVAEHEDTSILRWSIEEHFKSKPVSPTLIRLISEDMTDAAFVKHFSTVGVGTIVSTEAGLFIGKNEQKITLQANKMWRSESIHIAKARSNIYIEEPRLTMLLMFQPSEFDAIVSKKGERSRGSGFWSRFLTIAPEPTQGRRSYNGRDYSWEHLGRFEARMGSHMENLIKNLRSGGRSRAVVDLTEEAGSYWAGMAEKVQSELGSGGRYERATDHAAKLPENVARVAALLHFFEGVEGGVSEAMLKLAWDICDRCSVDFMRLFVPPPEEHQDAEIVWNQQLQRYRARGMPYVSTSYALRRRPSVMRDDGAVRYHKALDVLQDAGYIRLLVDDKKAEWIILDPGFVPHIQSRWQAPVLNAQRGTTYPVFRAIDEPEQQT